MSVHLVDFLVLSSGVERAVVIVLILSGVAGVMVKSTVATGGVAGVRGVYTDGGVFADLMALASLATLCVFAARTLAAYKAASDCCAFPRRARLRLLLDEVLILSPSSESESESGSTRP
jgi:hypothetical protein